MKLLTILYKNFKLLLRSKSSAFMVIMSPLIIIALILLTFSTTQDTFEISIGVIAGAENVLAQDFISELELDGYKIINYYTLDQCVNEIKLSLVNLCLNFPDNFDSEDDVKKSVDFYVDQSRINLVESIISSVGSNIGSKSEEITLSKTKSLMASINESASKIIESQNNSTFSVENVVEDSIDLIELNNENINENSEDSEKELIDSGSDISGAEDDITEASSSYSTLYSQIQELMDAIGDSDNVTGDIKTEYDALNLILESENSDITTSLDELEDVVGSLEDKISTANTHLTETNNQLNSISDSSEIINEELSLISFKVEEIKQNLELIKNEAENIVFLSAENVENPFDITVNEILSTSNKSFFMFPYYVMLLILFVGMMLSSNLVIMEKQSLAFFRNHTTPTSSLTHLIARFLTNLIILSLQLSLVLFAAYYFLNLPIFTNYKVSLVLLIISSSFFIFLGYFIGYLFKTQEAITIAFISIAGLLAFLSNLILPIEAFSSTIRNVLMFNPYMLSSELLKKAMIFNTGYVGLGKGFLLLLGYVFLIFILVVILQKISLFRLSLGFSQKALLKRPHINNDNFFRLDSGILLKDLHGLETALRRMKDKEFAEYVTSKNNEFALWIKEVLKDKKISIKIRKAKSRTEMVQILEDKRLGKEETRNWLQGFIYK